MMNSKISGIAAVRSLASHFKQEELELCLQQQLTRACNRCHQDTDNEQAMNVLAKATFIRKEMQQGVSLKQAIRDLGRRMRLIQGSE